MTANQYRAALLALNLSIVGGGPKELGIGGRQSQRYAAGHSKVPEPIAKLLVILLKKKGYGE